MASLPSVAINATLKLQPELTKNTTVSPLLGKSSTFSYSRTQTINGINAIESIKPLDYDEALAIIKDGTNVESSYYVPLLQKCIDDNSVSNANIVHAHLIKTGTHEDFFVTTFVVNVYAKCGAMDDARRVFDKLSRQNIVAWTTLITGYVQNSKPELGLNVFIEMLETGCFPVSYTLGAALNACSALNSIDIGKQIHAYIIKYKIEYDTSVGNSLCSLYSKCGSLVSAVKAFEKIEDKNVVSWTSLISACGDNNRAHRGLRFFGNNMMNDGVIPNDFTLTTVLSLCSMVSDYRLGSQVHSLSMKLGYGSSLRIRNSVMYLYLKCGFINEARILFNGNETVSLVTWNALIAGYAQSMDLTTDHLSAYRNGKEALDVFLKLNRSSMKPDLYTFSSILSVCSGLVGLEQGEQVHARVLKTGLLSDVVVGTALVNMYSKCGSIERASKAFLEMDTRTLVSWTCMISGFANHGQTEQALQLFDDMRLTGQRPNQVTFVGVFAACSHAGKVVEALDYLDIMRKMYKIKPVMDHYVCLIDMYVRLNRLEEAFDFVKKMDFPPNGFIWSILVAGCRKTGNTELGLYAANRLLEINTKDIEIYGLLLDLYISAEKWEEVSKVRDIMRDMKLENIKDWSWMSIKDKVHSFKPNDRLHPRSTEIYGFLKELLEKANEYGYETAESFELIDEYDEAKTFSSTVYHGEKLAVAFGLLNTPNAAPIRVVKSVSMCRDCHCFMKVVSSVSNRIIVIRDSKRLHRFVNGNCSCGDFSGLL